MEHIYKITFPNNKVYIGKAKDIESRWCQHKREAHKGNNLKLYKAMRDYGIVNLKFDVLGGYDSVNIFTKEKEYIDKYDSVDNGYNTYSSVWDMCYTEKQVIELFTNKVYKSKKEACEHYGLKVGGGSIYRNNVTTIKTTQGKRCFMLVSEYIELDYDTLNSRYIHLLMDNGIMPTEDNQYKKVLDFTTNTNINVNI